MSSRPEAGTPQSSLGPTPVNERIESLDVLRGLALFMILTANMAGFYSPLYYLDEAARHFGATRADRFVDTLIFTFVQNESVALFSFLFGFGFAMQFLRDSLQGVSFIPLYVRRLLTLVLIGLVLAYLIWTGDIVALYGVLGFFLLPFRNVNLRAVLAIALAFYFLPQIRWEVALIRNSNGPASMGVASSIDTAEVMAQEEARRQAENSVHAYGHGTWREMTVQRATDYSFYIKHNQALTVFPLFLLGLYAGRCGLFSDIPKHLSAFRFVAASSLAAALLSVLSLRMLYLQGIPDWTRLLRPVLYAIWRHLQPLAAWRSAITFFNPSFARSFSTAMGWRSMGRSVPQKASRSQSWSSQPRYFSASSGRGAFFSARSSGFGAVSHTAAFKPCARDGFKPNSRPPKRSDSPCQPC